MIICYKILPDLPLVPEHFVSRALEIANDRSSAEVLNWKAEGVANPEKYRRRVMRNAQEEIVRTNVRYKISDEFDTWVKNNISEEMTDAGVSTSLGDASDLQSPHTDGSRTYGLMYVIDQSNFDQDTVFWKEPGKSLHRKRSTAPYELDHLERLDQVRIPPKTWCYLDTTILHSIENIKGKRIAIQVSFDSDPFGVFMPI